MTYVLIIIFLGHYGNAATVTEFNTREACLEAANQVAKATVTTYGAPKMVCAAKGVKS